jgi:hypothetical protein
MTITIGLQCVWVVQAKPSLEDRPVLQGVGRSVRALVAFYLLKVFVDNSYRFDRGVLKILALCKAKNDKILRYQGYNPTCLYPLELSVSMVNNENIRDQLGRGCESAV